MKIHIETDSEITPSLSLSLSLDTLSLDTLSRYSLSILSLDTLSLDTLYIDTLSLLSVCVCVCDTL
jgi:hypothetical protein